MSKRHGVLQVLQFSAVVIFAVGTAQAQLTAIPNGRFHAPLVRLPAGEFDVATAALAGPEHKQPAYVAAMPPTLNAPSALNAPSTLNVPSAPTAAEKNFDPLAPPQIEGASGEDSWAPPLPPEKSATVKAEKPRILERIRQRWTGGKTKPAGNDPADHTPQIGGSNGESSVAASPPAPQPAPTAKRGWFGMGGTKR